MITFCFTVSNIQSERWGAGVVVCLEQDADLHMAQLMPLPLSGSCFSKIQIGFTFLVPAHLSSNGKRAVKRACVCIKYSTRTLKAPLLNLQFHFLLQYHLLPWTTAPLSIPMANWQHKTDQSHFFQFSSSTDAKNLSVISDSQTYTQMSYGQ